MSSTAIRTNDQPTSGRNDVGEKVAHVVGKMRQGHVVVEAVDEIKTAWWLPTKSNPD